MDSFSPRFPFFEHSIDSYISFINKHHLEKALVITNDISFLTECPTLKYLWIVPADSADCNLDLSPLYNHPKLLYLYCHTEYGYNFGKHCTVDYSRINGLEKVQMSGEGHFNIDSVKTLKTLTVARSKEKDLFGLFCSSELDALQVVDSSIESLNGAERSDKLLHVELMYNRRLRDISALKYNRKTLKSLVIRNCAKIEDFSILESLENLEQLAIYGSNSLQSLSFLNSLRKLKVFGFDVNVVDGDLTPCMSIPRVYCARQRKHYNLKEKDLPKADFSPDIGFEGIEMWRRF